MMNKMMMHKRKGGFTLVELMVVAIIVAILAAVAIPLMSANKKRAAATEAEAGLGSIRSALRAMYAETGAYNKDLNNATITTLSQVPGMALTDLDGRYFNSAAYSVTLAAAGYTLTATGNSSTAPQASLVAGVTITLDQAGAFTRTGM